jgi:hypothetical protein
LTSALPVVISALPAILSIAAIAPSTLLVVLTGSERSQRRRRRTSFLGRPRNGV